MSDPGQASPGPGARRAAWRDISGILLFDKPLGWSSNFALQRVRRLFAARKAGHTGSLDPLATGMLPICLGEATKVSGSLLDSDKEYRVRMALGTRTATGDAEGPAVATGPARLTEEALDAALATLRGPILQVPPMYSALKHEGRRLYQLARTGVEVDRPARPVEILELRVEAWDPGAPVLRVRCTKGTYIRTLVEDIARAAGTVAHVAELRRLRVEPFPADGLLTLGTLESLQEAGLDALDARLLPVDAALAGMPGVTLSPEDATRLRHGQAVWPPGMPVVGPVRAYDPSGRFLGIGDAEASGRLVARRLMATSSGCH